MDFLWKNNYLRRLLCLTAWIWYLTLLVAPAAVHAQAGYELDLKKPPIFENKVLGSEKSNTTKWTDFRSFVQSTVTHYNYYFNANQKILEVLAKARLAHQDDLTQLIPFYNYALPATRKDSIQLDSVIYKCTGGIVLHDLRNNWIDNLYLLIGKAFLLEMKFDSADHILEFLNYHFYVKEKGDYHIAIGTRTQAQNGQISVLNPENHSILHEAFNRPPSRNEGLIWQVRSYTEQEKYPQASGLMSLLRTDPILPARLVPELDEQQAYWFYRQGMYDSTIVYLTRALPAADDLQEQARWEYLLAQLSERCNHQPAAVGWYDKAIAHSTDPRIDIYARLYRALLVEGTSKEELPNTIAALLRLARKDRFAPFGNILYLATARLALKEPDTTAALHFLNQSVTAVGPIDIHNQGYLLLADLGRARGDYKIVARAYDSLKMIDPSLANRKKELTADKTLYDNILTHILRVEREDSLQQIAAMPEAARTLYVKALLRRLLKAQGLKDENGFYGGSTIRDSLNGTDLFAGQTTGNGEWYFYNSTTLSQGAQEFESRWGNRPNVDNWRRQNAVNALAGLARPTPEPGADSAHKNNKAPVLTLKGLLAGLPLTDKALQISNDTIAHNLYQLGVLYKDEVGDYHAAVLALEELYRRFPSYQTENTLFDLWFCWHELGDEVKAAYYHDLLRKGYPGGKMEKLLNTEGAPKQADPVQEAATNKYKEIYDQFIAGNYAEALEEKKAADSAYGKKYWTPQLMYIEAVYFAHERQDSAANTVLSQEISQFPKDPLTPRATRLKDVLSRRKTIEQYLTNLHVTRDKEDSTTADTASQVAKAPPPVVQPGPPDLHKPLANASIPLLQTPTMGMGTIHLGKTTLVVNPEPIKGLHSDIYLFDASAPHVVLLIMTQVSSVYSGEAKNAFNRYNQDLHYNVDIPVDTVLLQQPGISIVRMGPFQNIVEALAYQYELQREAGKDIIPWMTKDKYRFVVISLDNLAVLRQKKNLAEYDTFIQSYLKNLPKN